MSVSPFFWTAVFGSLLLALGSLGAYVLYEVAWHELKELCRRNNRRDLFDRIHDSYDDVLMGVETTRVVSFALIVIGLVGSSLATPVPALPAGTKLLWGLGILFGSLLVAVWLPAALARVWAESILYHGWRVFDAVARCAMPLSLATYVLESIFRRGAGVVEVTTEESAFEEELMTIVTEGLHDGHLEAAARQMIEGVFDLDDYNAADIMTPRSDVEAIDIDLPMDEVVKFAVRCGRTRIPVYADSLDHVIGILYVKDLLSELARANPNERRPLREMLRPHWSIPKTRPLDALLKDFLRTRTHLAIVLDEYSGVAGLVTIEDVLEEIVGEIVDETDREELGEIRRLDDHHAEINGRAHLADINAQLGLDLPEPEAFDTIAGLVIDRLGRIPKVGESVSCGNVRITVLSATERKVEQVLLEALDGIAAGDATT